MSGSVIMNQMECLTVYYIVIHTSLSCVLSYICCLILTCAIQTVGTKETPRKGVYIDPNYVRQSPRKRRAVLFSPSPSKGDSGGPPTPKQGRPAKYHAGRECGDCTIWLQLDSPEHLKKMHKISSRASHPDQDNVIPWICWLRKGGHDIDLRYDSCLCPACYHDCRDEKSRKA